MPMLKHVRSGDPLVIPASTFNTFVDAARDFQQRQRDRSRDAERDFRQSGLVLVRNESGADRGRFDVLGINGPLITRQQNPDEFARRIAFRGALPADPAHSGGRFAVLTEPVRAGATGRAWFGSPAIARVLFRDEGHPAADIKDWDANVLESNPGGSSLIVAAEPPQEREVADIGLCIVLLNAGSPVFPVQVTEVEGNAWPRAYRASRLRGNSFLPAGASQPLLNLAELRYPPPTEGFSASCDPLAVGDVVPAAWWNRAEQRFECREFRLFGSTPCT